MKKLLFLLFLFALPAFAQNVRYDAPFPSVSSQTQIPFLVANVPPNSPILAVCAHPANQVPCTNYVTTYTSLGAACSNGAQDTPQPQPSSCQSTGDAQGNIGFWAPAGTYDYTVCISNDCLGPYTITLGGQGGGSGTLQDPGANGIVFRSAPTVTQPAISSDVVNLFSGCSGSLALSADGTCHPAGTGNMSTTPAAGVSQVPFQLPNSAGTTMSVYGSNQFNNIWYPPAPAISTTGTAAIPVTTIGANFSQSPTSPSTISAGSTTVTFPNGCPPGIATTATMSSIAANWDYIYIAGTGTPEAVLVTGTTCPLFGGGAAGTVTFTAANSHSAGYTITSASSGLEETFNSSLRCIYSRPCSIQKGMNSVIVPPGDYIVKGRVVLVNLFGETVDFTTSAIVCQLSDTCLYIGDSGFTGRSNSTTLRNLFMVPAIVNGNFPAVEDNGQGVTIDGITPVQNSSVANSSFGSLVKIDTDESFEIRHMNVGGGSGGWAHCYDNGTTFCSVALQVGPGSPAPTGTIIDSNMTLGCVANGIDNPGNNTLSILSTVIQAYPQFGIRSRQSFSTAPNLLISGNGYEEIGSCTNPLGTGIAGLVLQTGYSSYQGMVGPAGNLPVYANSGATGTTHYQYYIVVKSGATASAPMESGIVKTDGTAGNITVKWPAAGSTGTITYDILRTSSTSPYSPFAPYTAVLGGGSSTAGGSVALAQTCTPVNGVCSYTDTVTASTSAYTVPLTPNYFPDISGYTNGITPWPGNIVLSGNENASRVSQTFATLSMPTLSTQVVNSSSFTGIVSVTGALIPSITANNCSNGGLWNQVWITCQTDNVGGYGATLVPLTSGDISMNYGTQGATNYVPELGSTVQGSHIITLLNTNAAATLNDSASSLYRRTPWNATDSYIAIDNPSGNVALTNAQLAFGNNKSISNYIGTNPDNTSWLERLTSSLKSFTVPVTGTSATWSSTSTAAGFILSTSALSTSQIANAGTTGTTLNKLVKLSGAPSAALIAATTDTSGVLGVCIAGCGTTSSATIALQGIASCVFDGATTAGDYVQISSSTTGDCHDTAASYPTSGQVIGRVMTSNGGGGTYSLALNIDIEGFSGSGSSTLAGLTDVQISAASDQQVLTYVAADSKWENKNPSISTPAFQVNGTPLSSATTINYLTSSAFNGLTSTFTNPSAGGVQLGFSGSLGLGGGGLGITSGTSGGIPYFSSTSSVASSGALGAGQFVLGGGPGSSPTSANLTGDVTTSGSAASTIANNAVTSAKMAVVNTYRVCGMVFGSDNTSGAVLASGDIAPQTSQCFLPANSTVVEVDVFGDAGTSSVTVARNRAGTVTALTSSQLAMGASGARACSNTGGTGGIGSGPTCSGTLTTTSLNAGDVLQTSAATADGVTRSIKIFVTYTIN